MTSLYAWSKSAGSNGNSDSAIAWPEGQTPGSVNNSARAVMGRVAEFRDDISGAVTATGTANGIVVTANSGFTTLANGRIVAFTAAYTNTGAVNLNVNSLGAKSVRLVTPSGDTALTGGEIRAGAVYLVMYASALNSSAGGWQLIGGSGVSLQQTKTDKFWKTDGARITRFTDRFLVGQAATDFSGESTESTSYVADDAGSGYIDRAATFASYSQRGGIGGAFGTRSSDQYASFPNQYAGVTPSVWTSGGSATTGQRVAYNGRVYTISSGGTYSSSPPIHTSGSASNGTATLAFIDYTYMCGIAGSFFAVQDSNDPTLTVWAMYAETVSVTQTSTFIGEFAAKNMTGLDPVTTPYNKFSTAMGICMAGGGDSSLGAPTNPSSHALLIYKNGHTWNTGIVFDAEGITGTDGVSGFGNAIKMARGHVINWMYDDGGAGLTGFDLTSVVDDATAKQTLYASNDGTSVLNNSSLAVFKVAKVAGSVTGSIGVVASTSASPYLEVEGSATNINFDFATKGTGEFRFNTNSSAKQFEIVHTASAVNWLRLTGAATGNPPTLSSQGSDTNIGLNLASKGTGSVNLFGNSAIVAAFTGVSSGVNRINVQNAATAGSPIVAAQGSDTNVTGTLLGQGTGGWDLQSGDSASKIKFNTTGIGFFGTTPAARPTGVAVDAAGIHAALVTLGLITA